MIDEVEFFVIVVKFLKECGVYKILVMVIYGFLLVNVLEFIEDYLFEFLICNGIFLVLLGGFFVKR